jgi:hypothetical protein
MPGAKLSSRVHFKSKLADCQPDDILEQLPDHSESIDAESRDENATVEAVSPLEHVRSTRRDLEIVEVHPGAVVNLTRIDEVADSIEFAGPGSEIVVGVDLRILKVELVKGLRTGRSVEIRRNLRREVSITVDGNFGTRWEVGFEDFWQSAQARVQGHAVPFEFLVRTNVIARSIDSR